MTHRDEMEDLSSHTWTRLVANCIIWLTILGVILSRVNLLDVHSTIMGVCLGLSIVAIVYLATQRTTMLPFLGPTIVPPSLLKHASHSPMADIEVDVRVDPRATHVAYWAANPAATRVGDPDPRTAYGKFGNNGIALANEDGSATLRVQCPGRYAVRGNVLPKHVHYREVYPSGIMGEVKKANILCS
jgi:hypothetical protein